MIAVERFKLEDLELLDVQERHQWVKDEVSEKPEEYEHQFEGYAWTIWNVYGIPLVCCGITKEGWCWAFLSRDLRRWMVPVTRAVMRLLRNYGDVSWAEIDETHPAAVRWAKMLNFRRVQSGVWTHL